MQISQIKQLDVGMSGITTKGNVGYCGKPQHVVGTGQNGDYDFWSQFVTLEDNTDKIGASFTISENQPLVKGKLIFVEKATLDMYVKDNKDVLKLKVSKWNYGQQSALPPSQQTLQQPNQAIKEDKPDWNAISQGKVRHGVVCAYIAAGKEPALTDVEYWVEYIMTGHAPLPPNQIPKRQADEDDIPPDDDPIPF